MGSWFETVAEAQRRAARRLPRAVYAALVAGSERGTTAADNLAAFAELGFAPRAAGLSAAPRVATRVLGLDLDLPVLISPVGVQAVHPEGELPVARAAAARGTAMGLSCFAARPVEEVVAANPRTLAQLHWIGTRDDVAAFVDRARRAGAAGLVVTLDWSFASGRDSGSPWIPERIDREAVRRYAPQVLARPRYLAGWLRAGRLPDLAVPNLARPGEPAPTFFEAYRRWQASTPPGWADLAWLREQWAGPLLLKGVLRVDDARRAVDAGVDALSVSNHGGNNLDGSPASIRALPAVAEAVGDRVEVLLDGGVRRGGDVAKALALGARAVLVGRAPLWGLAAAGQAGVENVLDLLRDGLRSALTGLGHDAPGELTRDDLVVPAGFERRMGTGV
ncbi:pre-mycofactocin synthase MftD [Blastococcus sp. SYSU D00820]